MLKLGNPAALLRKAPPRSWIVYGPDLDLYALGDFAPRVLVGSDGAVYLSVIHIVGGLAETEVVKFASSGALLWKQRIYRSGVSTYCLMADVSPDGLRLLLTINAFTGGSTYDDSGLIQLNTSDGSTHTQRMFGYTTSSKVAERAVYDEAGDIFTLGSYTSTYPDGYLVLGAFTGSDLTTSAVQRCTNRATNVSSTGQKAIHVADGIITAVNIDSSGAAVLQQVAVVSGVSIAAVANAGLISSTWTSMVGNVFRSGQGQVFVLGGEQASGNTLDVLAFDSSLAFQWGRKVNRSTYSSWAFHADKRAFQGGVLSLSANFGDSSNYTTTDEFVFDSAGNALLQTQFKIHDTQPSSQFAPFVAYGPQQKAVALTMAGAVANERILLAVLPHRETEQKSSGGLYSLYAGDPDKTVQSVTPSPGYATVTAPLYSIVSLSEGTLNALTVTASSSTYSTCAFI